MRMLMKSTLVLARTLSARSEVPGRTLPHYQAHTLKESITYPGIR
jgi:hypothetical protein